MLNLCSRAGNTTSALSAADVLDLSQCDVVEQAPGYNRLILKIVPTTQPPAPPSSSPLLSSLYTQSSSSSLSSPSVSSSSLSTASSSRRIGDSGTDGHNHIGNISQTGNVAPGRNTISVVVDVNADYCHSEVNETRRTTAPYDISGDMVQCTSSLSLNGGGAGGAGGDREKVLFIGFEESWERDLWSAWLIEVSA